MTDRFSQMEARLMKTIVALCTKETPFEDVADLLPQLDVLRIRLSLIQQHRLAANLWDIYSKLLNVTPPGTEIDLDSFFHALSITLLAKSTGEQLVESALSATASIIDCAGFTLAALCSRLNNLLIDDAGFIPKPLCWKTLKRINDALSSSSQLHEYFHKFASSLIENIVKGDSLPADLVNLVASIIRTSASMLKASDLQNLQKEICLAVFEGIPEISMLKLLNALLEHHHEAVALPIQVARTIFWRNYNVNNANYRTELMRGRFLCEIYVRPRKIPCCAFLKPNDVEESLDKNNVHLRIEGPGILPAYMEDDLQSSVINGHYLAKVCDLRPSDADSIIHLTDDEDDTLKESSIGKIRQIDNKNDIHAKEEGNKKADGEKKLTRTTTEVDDMLEDFTME